MNIAVIGAGSVGRALGIGWAKQGHRIIFGVREPSGEGVNDLKQSSGNVRVATNAEAARNSQVIALCTPWEATKGAIQSCGQLAGKTIIDCTNPLKADFSGLALGFDTSGAEEVASLAKGAQVFKAMNQIGSNRMDQPKYTTGTPVMFVCGDGDNKSLVLDLVHELGFDAVDAGGLSIARLIEPYAMLWIHLALVQKLGRDVAFALLRE